MTAVRIAHAEPQPGWRPDGGFAVSSYLVVLADDAGGRALPIWLTGSDGESLGRLLDRPAADAGITGVAEELAGRLLTAAGVIVTGVDIDEADPAPVARIELAGPAGPQYADASLGYALALAVAAAAPFRVAAAVLDRLAIPVPGDDLLGPVLAREARPEAGRAGGERLLPRYEPRNLAFADGLDRWEFGGDFRRHARQEHGPDYSCTTGTGTTPDGSAVLASAVPEPRGFAALLQAIFADDYRGGTVVFRAELRTTDVTDQAGLHLHVGPPPRRAADTVTGSQDWTRHEVTAQVPGDARLIRFGIFLTGRGRVEVRRAELVRGR
jgi:hypothetical protein